MIGHYNNLTHHPLDTNPSFSALALRAELLQAIAEAGYLLPTPIQAQAIPVIMSGRDVMGQAQTGTGKTAGFALPILHKLAAHANNSSSPARHPIRALILAPTRELAIQVEESFREYGKHTGLRSTVVYGGVGIERQTNSLRKGVDILVATPGRLLDHVQQGSLSFTQVEIFVLDEADRMLDMGFIPDVKRIISLLPAKRQNLLFSATYSTEIKKLAQKMLTHPEMIAVVPRNTAAETVLQSVYKVPAEQKRAALAQIIKDRQPWQVLVFCRTKQGAGRLARQLHKDGIEAVAIHGDRSQAERIKALSAFKAGKIHVLVATDIAARGIDIDELPLVINFELPYVPEDYIHRIGRTGRAGASGEAISLVAPEEQKQLTAIEKLLKRSLPCLPTPGVEPMRAHNPPQTPARTHASTHTRRAREETKHARRTPPSTQRVSSREIPVLLRKPTPKS